MLNRRMREPEPKSVPWHLCQLPFVEWVTYRNIGLNKVEPTIYSYGDFPMEQMKEICLVLWEQLSSTTETVGNSFMLIRDAVSGEEYKYTFNLVNLTTEWT